MGVWASKGLLCAKGRWASGVRKHKTLSALGRWVGFGWDEIASSLVGFAGCQFLGLVWFLSRRQLWVITVDLADLTSYGSVKPHRIRKQLGLLRRRRPRPA